MKFLLATVVLALSASRVACAPAPFALDSREALSVAANPDGSLSPQSKAALRQWNARYYGNFQYNQKREALPVADKRDWNSFPYDLDNSRPLEEHYGVQHKQKREALPVVADKRDWNSSPDSRYLAKPGDRKDYAVQYKQKREALPVAAKGDWNPSPHELAADRQWKPVTGA